MLVLETLTFQLYFQKGWRKDFLATTWLAPEKTPLNTIRKIPCNHFLPYFVLNIVNSQRYIPLLNQVYDPHVKHARELWTWCPVLSALFYTRDLFLVWRWEIEPTVRVEAVRFLRSSKNFSIICSFRIVWNVRSRNQENSQDWNEGFPKAEECHPNRFWTNFPLAWWSRLEWPSGP